MASTRRSPLINLLLFALTLLTTTAAGALNEGADIFTEPALFWKGLPFSLTLMVILLSHEFGHYFAARSNYVSATLPYFIPIPPIPAITLIGTLGAFIRLRSPIMTRRALIEIGASGPLIGFVVSVAACVVGLSMSKIVPTPVGVEGMLVFGDSVLFKLLTFATLGPLKEGYDVMLHPVAFAGWIGLFVTMLNLMPVGQLDGGHIMFGLMGGVVHRHVGLAFVVMLGALGAFYWTGWLVWALLMVVLRIEHPPVLYWEVPLDTGRRAMAWASVAVFLLCFIPQPIDVYIP